MKKRHIVSLAAALVLVAATAALALDATALVGKWQLVERAKDSQGNPCPFVGEQIQFTADGRMISPNMPVVFRYKVNPTPAEAAVAIERNPELKGMDVMLAMVGNGQNDWSKAPIAYGLQVQGKQLVMKVSGYTPSRYKKQK